MPTTTTHRQMPVFVVPPARIPAAGASTPTATSGTALTFKLARFSAVFIRCGLLVPTFSLSVTRVIDIVGVGPFAVAPIQKCGESALFEPTKLRFQFESKRLK